MASIDVLQPLEDRRTARTGRFLGLQLLLAEYRRAVAAEKLYEQFRRTRALSRSEVARAVFDELYANGTDQPRRPR